jgi:hypothetical protein
MGACPSHAPADLSSESAHRHISCACRGSTHRCCSSAARAQHQCQLPSYPGCSSRVQARQARALARLCGSSHRRLPSQTRFPALPLPLRIMLGTNMTVMTLKAEWAVMAGTRA